MIVNGAAARSLSVLRNIIISRRNLSAARRLSTQTSLNVLSLSPIEHEKCKKIIRDGSKTQISIVLNIFPYKWEIDRRKKKNKT